MIQHNILGISADLCIQVPWLEHPEFSEILKHQTSPAIRELEIGDLFCKQRATPSKRIGEGSIDTGHKCAEGVVPEIQVPIQVACTLTAVA